MIAHTLTPGPSPKGRGKISLGQQVRGVEPPVEQAPAGLRRSHIAAVPPYFGSLAQLRHQGRHQLFRTGLPQRFIRRKPADFRVEDGIWRLRKVFIQGH